MKPPSGELVIYSGHASWRSMLDFHLGSLAAALAGGAIAKLATKQWGIAIAVFAAVLAISILVGFVRRSATRYEITHRRLYIRRGLLSRSEQHTTIERIQNVETHQTLFERILRIGTVSFDTAATDGSDFKFEGVATPRQVVRAVDSAQETAEPALPGAASTAADVAAG